MAVITTTCTNTENITSPGTQTSTTSTSENGTSTTTTSTSNGTNTTNTSTTTTTSDNLSIINTLFADISAVVPNYTSLVASYRLLVGAAEEIQRTPGVPFEIFERAVIRYDRAGTLIDMLNELLCCKIAFSTELLSITCAPIDIVKTLTNCISGSPEDQCTSAEQIVVLEALRQTIFRSCSNTSCFGPPPDGITPPHPSAPPPTPPVQKPPSVDVQSDLETTEELETEASVIIPKFKSPLARKHI